MIGYMQGLTRILLTAAFIALAVLLAVSSANSQVGPSITAFDTDEDALAELVGQEFGTGEFSHLNTFAFSPDGRYLAAAGWISGDFGHGLVKIWDVASGREVFAPLRPEVGSGRLGFSPDGRILAVSGNSVPGHIALYDVKTGKDVRTQKLDGIEWQYSPDARYLATHSYPIQDSELGHVRLLEAASGSEVVRLPSPVDSRFPETAVSFSPDSRFLAAVTQIYPLKLWKVPEGQTVSPEPIIPGWTDWGYGPVVFSPDSRLLATRTNDFPQSGEAPEDLDDLFQVTLWDLTQRTRIRSLDAGGVSSMAFTPDGRLLATVSDNGTRLWDVERGQEVRNLGVIPKDTGGYSRVAFSRDGRLLAVATYEGTVVWEANSGRSVLALDSRSRIGRFSPDSRSFASLVIGEAAGESSGVVRLVSLFPPDRATVAGVAIDWSQELPSRPPYGIASWRVPGRVLAGEATTLKLNVENTGKGPIVKLLARLSSGDPSLDGKPAVFGRLDPGSSLTREIPLSVPRTHPGGEVRVEARFEEANGNEPEPVSCAFVVEPLPRPSFALSWRLTDESSASLAKGNGDGVLQKRESGELALHLANVGEGDAENVSVSLTVPDLPGLKAFGERAWTIDRLAPGEARTFTVGLQPQRAFQGNAVVLALTAQEPTFGVSLNEQVQVAIGSPTAANPVAIQRSYRSRGLTLELRGGADETAPVTHRIEGASDLTGVALLGDWVKVQLPGGTGLAWAAIADLTPADVDDRTAPRETRSYMKYPVCAAISGSTTCKWDTEFGPDPRGRSRTTPRTLDSV